MTVSSEATVAADGRVWQPKSAMNSKTSKRLRKVAAVLAGIGIVAMIVGIIAGLNVTMAQVLENGNLFLPDVSYYIYASIIYSGVALVVTAWFLLGKSVDALGDFVFMFITCLLVMFLGTIPYGIPSGTTIGAAETLKEAWIYQKLDIDPDFVITNKLQTKDGSSRLNNNALGTIKLTNGDIITYAVTYDKASRQLSVSKN